MEALHVDSPSTTSERKTDVRKRENISEALE